MKKLISMIFIIGFIFVLSACKNTENTTADDQDRTQSSSVDTTDAQGVASSDVQDSSDAVSATDTPTEAEENEPAVTESVPLDKVDTEGVYKTKQIQKIDVPCAEELEKAQSDSLKITIYDKYAQEWGTVANRYYNELLKVNGSVPATVNYNTAEQMHEYLENYKQDWESRSEEQGQLYLDKMTDGADNTPVKLMYAQWDYESKRELALYFIGIYEELESFSNQGY